jgi:hypothetical protein
VNRTAVPTGVRVCVFRKALRHKEQGHFKDTTWTSADDDGDPSVALRAWVFATLRPHKMEGRLRTVNDLRFSHLVIRNRRPFSSTGSGVSHRTNENATYIQRASVLRNKLTIHELRR